MIKKQIGEEFFLTLSGNIKEGVRFIDERKRLTYLNHEAETLTGYSSDEVVGKKCHERLEKHIDKSNTAQCDFHCPVDSVFSTGEPFDGQLCIRTKNGGIIPVAVNVLPVFGKRGKVIGAVELMTDDRPRLELEELKRDIKRFLPIDVLTGLYVKDKIVNQIEVRLENSKRYGAPLGVVLIVLEDIAAIRKGYGDKKVEEIFQRVGYLIRMNTRRGDTSGRLGPEEFLMLLPNSKSGDIELVASKIKLLIIEDTHIVYPEQLNIRVGFARFRDGDDSELIIKRARDALTPIDK